MHGSLCTVEKQEEKLQESNRGRIHSAGHRHSIGAISKEKYSRNDNKQQQTTDLASVSDK